MSARVDAVWFNADVLTLGSAAPRAQALAVSGGRIVALGTNEAMLAMAGAGAARHDLAGRFVMPGLIDTHLHGIWGALRDLYEVSVGLSSSLDQLLAAVAQRVQGVAPGLWISGGVWHQAWFDNGAQPPRDLLDAVSPGHPVVLRDITYHSMWLNSAALRVCGVDRYRPDPPGGRIGRDARGEPDGLLFESAQGVALPFLKSTPEQFDRAVRYMRGYFHSLGLTGFKEAMANEGQLEAYAKADRAQALQLHAAMHLARNPLDEPQRTPFETLEDWRQRFRTQHVQTGYVKLFLDGVAPSRTASFLEPYWPLDTCSGGRHDPDAQLLIAPAELDRELIELDRRGFVVKMHAVGDRAARAGLDAIAAARRTNGNSGLRHEIGHAPFIDDADKPRFAALDAVAEMSPRLWFPNPVTAGQVRVLGPVRTHRCHQIRSLIDAGAQVTYGSDWPAAAADANPWIGLAGMLNRRNPFGLFSGELGADQAVPLDRALPLFTTQAARSMGLQAVTGSLEPGKSADFVVLDRPLNEQTPAEIAVTRVRRTVFEGQTVYES